MSVPSRATKRIASGLSGVIISKAIVLPENSVGTVEPALGTICIIALVITASPTDSSYTGLNLRFTSAPVPF